VGETGLLEGIDDTSIRRNTALLLENQLLANGKMINEALTGGTDTSDVSQFRRISIPLVRRIYPQLVANKIVSVSHCLAQQVLCTTCVSVMVLIRAVHLVRQIRT